MLYFIASTALLINAVAVPENKLFDNRVSRFFSGISMEIYLSHMVVFRVLEKVGLNRMLGDGWVQYIATVVMVFVGAMIYSLFMQRVIGKAQNYWNKRTERVGQS